VQWIHNNHHVISGYSDHTRGFHFPLAAVAMGAKIIEKHITLDYDVPNAQDWKVSCGPNDFSIFMYQLREIEAGLRMRDSDPTAGEQESLIWASKSLVPVRDVPLGAILQMSDLTAKRPGTGISPSLISEVIGKTAKETLFKDHVIQWGQLS
jgi:sialic acid synthase SpsE